MSEPTSASFLDGASIPVAMRDVEEELERLWGPAAEQAGGPDLDRPSVTRVVLANLVLVDLARDAAGSGEILRAVASSSPSRAIVIEPDDGTDESVRVEISAVCHLPAPGRPQVCSEQIVLRASSQALALLPGAVRSLLEPDVRDVLWWRVGQSTSVGKSLYEGLSKESTRVVVDAADPHHLSYEDLKSLLDPPGWRWTRDLAWLSLAPWREAIAHLFDPPSCADLPEIVRVNVTVESPIADRVPRAGAWLVAWLAGQLGWRPLDRWRASASRLDAAFQCRSGAIEATIEVVASGSETNARVRSVEIALGEGGKRGRFKVERPSSPSSSLQIHATWPSHCQVPIVVEAPEYDATKLVFSAMQSDRDDPPYRRALPVALWLLEP